MKTNAYTDWHHFSKKFLEKYHKLSPQRRRQLIFRGQADSLWPLRASLDRVRPFTSTADRERCLSSLIGRFRKHALSLSPGLGQLPSIEWELLGRHHGLPTSVLDFSRSPYVAAYFAFADPAPPAATHASIWVLDLAAFDTDALVQLTVLDQDELIRCNPRAQEQSGLFLKIMDATPVEDLLGDYLTRYDFPTGPSERAATLGILNAMMINARRLFRDLDGAARTAATDVIEFGEV
ncbi:MAG: FRG domain-containing protein [Fimbriiglobus sp.]